MNMIEQSIEWLVDTGWTDEQARHLIQALRCDSAERVAELAPQWIEHCAHLRQQLTLLECVAMGAVRVDHNGEDWTFALAVEGEA